MIDPPNRKLWVLDQVRSSLVNKYILLMSMWIFCFVFSRGSRLNGDMYMRVCDAPISSIII